MPVPALAAAGISAASQTVGNLANIAFQSATNAANRRFVEKQYRIQRADAIADRDYANAYNDPTAQMERLKKAGLNPHLVYGGGSAQTMSSGIQAPEMKSFQAQAPQIDLGYLSTFMEMRQRAAQTNLTEQQVENEKALIQLNELKFKLGLNDKERQEFDLMKDKTLLSGQMQLQEQAIRQGDQAIRQGALDLRIGEALEKTTIEGGLQVLANQKITALEQKERIAKSQQERNNLRAQINEINARIKNMATDNDLKIQELNLMKDGINRNDPTWLRVLMQQANKYGITDGSLYEKTKDWFRRGNFTFRAKK